MATKQPYKTTFEVDHVIQPIYTGGSVALDNGARILATTLGEDAVLTDLATGKLLAKIEGDGEAVSTLTLTPSASHLIVCSRSLSMRIYSLKVSEDYDSVEATLARTLKPHATPVVVLAVDRTSTLLATGAADGNIKVWDIQGGFVTHTFRGPSVLVSALHFFQIAAGGDADQQALRAASKKKKKGGRPNGADEDMPPEDANSATTNFRLASGSQDGRVRVWDLHRRSAIADLESHVSDVQALDYSAAQNTLVTASRDKTIIWWDPRTWKPRRVVPSFELVEAAGFLGDGVLTYSAGANGCVRLWETDTGREVTREQAAKSEEESIVSAVYCSEHSILLCVQMDHTLAVYRTPSVKASDTIHEMAPLEPERRISGTHDDIIDLGYLMPDQSLLALATNSEDVRIVSVSDGTESSARHFGQDVALLKGHEDIVITLDVDWSGHWIATGAKDNTARLWRIDPANNSYECYAVFSGHAESLGAVALPKTIPPESSSAYTDPLSHPPAFLITGSQDQTVKRWEIPRQAPQKGSSNKTGLRAIFTRKAHDKDINALDVHAAGHLFASASQDKTVKIWSVKEGEVQGILRGHRRGVWSVRFAPPHTPAIQGEEGASATAGRGVVLTGSGDKTVKLWNLTDYTCMRTFEGHSNSVLKVAWLNMPKEGGEEANGGNNKHRHVQFASAGGDGLVKVWDAGSGEAECTLDNHADRVWALAVHPRTNALVSGGGDAVVTLWRNTTAATREAAASAASRLVEQEQALENHVRAGAWRDALVLALQLNHPGRLLSLFSAVVSAPDPDAGSLTGRAAVDDVLAALSDEQLFLLLLRLRDWNTNARTAPVAQRVLGAIVRSYPAERLSGLKGGVRRGGSGSSQEKQQQQKSLGEVLHALRVYTERHYKRVEELVDESYLVEYTLREMDALPAMSAVEAGAGADGDVVMAEQ